MIIILLLIIFFTPLVASSNFTTGILNVAIKYI